MFNKAPEGYFANKQILDKKVFSKAHVFQQFTH